MTRLAVCVALCATTALALVPRAQAQEDMSDQWADRRNPTSPEHFALELPRIGLYSPDVGNPSFNDTFGTGGTIEIALELDVIVYRVPEVLWFGIGGGVGFAGFSGKAFDAAGNRVTETTSFTLVPMDLVAVLRVDVLARKLNWPFVFVGKLGADFDYWTTSTGTATDASGVSVGMRWAAQLEFELDFFDKKAARALDEAWGINHSFLFFEGYGVAASGFNGSLPVGTPFAWAAGLGFVF